MVHSAVSYVITLEGYTFMRGCHGSPLLLGNDMRTTDSTTTGNLEAAP